MHAANSIGAESTKKRHAANRTGAESTKDQRTTRCKQDGQRAPINDMLQTG